MTPEQARTEVAKQLPALAGGGGDGQQAKSRIVEIVAARRKISRPEAEAKVTRAKQQIVRIKNDTMATVKAAGATAGTSSVLVLALLIGAAASALCATAATRRRLR